jgi:hypothetical protein
MAHERADGEILVTKHASGYEPVERIRWLAWGHFVLSDRPFTNGARLREIEREIGILVTDTFAEHARGGLEPKWPLP